MNQNYQIFDRRRVRFHRDRAASSLGKNDFLLREMDARLADRLLDIKQAFPMALDLGAHGGQLAEYVKDMSGIETLMQADMSEAMMRKTSGLCVVADEEFLPFAAEAFDLVMSVGSLHWANDLPGAFIQINRILKPGGLFLAMLPGGETLKELRQSFEQAEIKTSGGLSPRISPFIDVKDAGSLLQRAGFMEPVTDSELLTVAYDDPMKLLYDLRGMGETNALITGAKNFTKRWLLSAAMEHYRQHFACENARVSATFELITLTAWKSH